ncbi:KIN17-like protein [Drosophila santomea]|uniref:KIN17-like protein n=1 Tax=Drosophila santomea TaxID=129105 RepID=UPI001953AABC|nr:KIN17-like protein [Drosophila santomea]
MARPLLLLLVLLLAAQLPHLAEGRSTTSSGGLTVIDSERLRIRTTSSTATASATAGAQHPNQATIPASVSPRKRHRKRNSNWIDYRNFDENTTALEWANPCGGNYHPSAGDRFNRQRPRQSFNQLKRHAFREYRSLNSSQDSAIDIRNMTMWSLHTHNYKFLPKLKPNSTIALKRWYRNMQTYVASFAYLRRQQIRWDQRSITRESSTARELRELLLSSRRILCELETAVNQTQSPRQKQRRSGAAVISVGGSTTSTTTSTSTSTTTVGQQLPQISRLEMNKRLKLRSKTSGSGMGGGAATSGASMAAGEADSIDMRFVKHHYYDFLRTMYQLLRRDGKRVRSRPRKHHKKHRNQQQRSHKKQQHQQQQQQPQQQQLADQLEQRWRSSTLNGKEFNEVSKPVAGGAAAGVAGASGGGNNQFARGRRGKRQSKRVQRT